MERCRRVQTELFGESGRVRDQEHPPRRHRDQSRYRRVRSRCPEVTACAGEGHFPASSKRSLHFLRDRSQALGRLYTRRPSSRPHSERHPPMTKQVSRRAPQRQRRFPNVGMRAYRVPSCDHPFHHGAPMLPIPTNPTLRPLSRRSVVLEIHHSLSICLSGPSGRSVVRYPYSRNSPEIRWVRTLVTLACGADENVSFESRVREPNRGTSEFAPAASK